MSNYTTQLRYICETEAGYQHSVGYEMVDDVLNKSWNKIFSFTFPLFDEEYREGLCKKILKHFYSREIGLETYGLWKLKLDAKMNEIMPYYNKMYESELLKIEPLKDTDVTTTHREKGNENSKTTTSDKLKALTRTNDNKAYSDFDRYSDTPQGSLSNVENSSYLTNARVKDGKETGISVGSSDSTANGTNEQTKKSDNEYETTVSGKTGGMSFSKMLMEYRETFLNIDMLIIDELEDLFMMLW